MRLDDYDDSIDVVDERGQSFGGGGFGGGFDGGGGFLLGALFSFIFQRFGCFGVILLLGAAAVFGVLPRLGHGPIGGGVIAHDHAALAAACEVNAYSHDSCNALASLDRTWGKVLAGSDVAFSKPKLVFYSGEGASGCGEAQSAMGPFYCPSDAGIYLDTDFYDELAGKLGAGRSDFARDYVIAHEFGHHIQNLMGTSARVERAERRDPAEANRLSVRLELQADCYAGVWAARNATRIDPGDITAGLKAAHQIGDDTLMKGAGRTPVEAAFTHGSAAQRMHWLKRGLDSGDPAACDTFGEMGA